MERILIIGKNSELPRAAFSAVCPDALRHNTHLPAKTDASGFFIPAHSRSPRRAAPVNPSSLLSVAPGDTLSNRSLGAIGEEVR